MSRTPPNRRPGDRRVGPSGVHPGEVLTRGTIAVLLLALPSLGVASAPVLPEAAVPQAAAPGSAILLPSLQQATLLPPLQLASPLAAADEPVGASPSLRRETSTQVGPYLGESLRYPQANVFRRLASDYAAIPLGVPDWSPGEWAWFGLTVGVTVGLFLPLDAPLDQRFQNWLAQRLPNATPGLWSPTNDLFIFGGLLSLALGTLAYGHLTDQDPYVETFSLMLEALALAQSLHISSKLLLSRDGPNNGNGRTIHGPDLGTFARFPEGAPSGHTATLFALATVVSTYWENPWLSVGVYSVATVFASALVLDRYHYISDVLWGGSMGVAVGRYVVHHRSSRFRYQEGRPQRVTPGLRLTPYLIPATPHSSAAAGGLVEGTF